MPWEADGRRWHTQDRVGRGGEPCSWDGRILAEVVDKIHELGEFSPTDWNSRTVVEICAARKSDGWFFHAITGEQWLLKLKFRVAKRTFQREDLLGKLDLKPLNEIADLPVYGSEPRVKSKNLRGPWQEVQLTVHSWDEVNRPPFWKFVAAAVEGFEKFTDRIESEPRRHHALESAGPEMAPLAQGFSAGQKGRLGYRVAGRPVRIAVGNGAAGTVSLEQSASGASMPPRPGRALGHDLHQAARQAWTWCSPVRRIVLLWDASRIWEAIVNCRPSGPTRTSSS